MTDRLVIDTNVLKVANGKSPQADSECELACIKMLEGAKGKRGVLIDGSDLIMGEYKRHCSYAGEPGLGDAFFKFLHDNEYSDRNVIRVRIQKAPDKAGGFSNLPPNNLHRDDRKFLAVAKAGNGRIVNATDSDWSQEARFVASIGVRVCELCPQCLKQNATRKKLNGGANP